MGAAIWGAAAALAGRLPRHFFTGWNGQIAKAKLQPSSLGQCCDKRSAFKLRGFEAIKHPLPAVEEDLGIQDFHG